MVLKNKMPKKVWGNKFTIAFLIKDKEVKMIKGLLGS